MGRVVKRNEEKVQIVFDVGTLNAILKYIRCEYVSHSSIYRLNKLFKVIDISKYSVDIKLRLMLIDTISSLMCLENIKDIDIIEGKISENPELYQLYKSLNLKANQLSQSEVDLIAKTIDEKLQAMAIYKYRDSMIELMRKFDNNEEMEFSNAMTKIKEICGVLLLELQESNADNSLLRKFSFSDSDYAEKLNVIVNKAKKPSTILQTGIRQLNALLSPGFQSGRLYTIIGGTGKFKSGTLLNIADQIRRFNPQIVPYENGRRKTILYITLENSIEETIERLYDMYSDLDSELRTTSVTQVFKTFKEDGKFDFTDNSGIDIDLQYYGNLEITTSDIYRIVKDLNNKGKDVIAIVLDYVKRIDSAHQSNGDERVRISFVGKELKNIAQELQVPMITAMQLNRGGNEILDAAIRENKEDVARFVGTSNIGNCWDLAEDSDSVILINLEMLKKTQQLFLSIKMLKFRGKLGKCSTYFNHPFVNDKNIRLETDVDKDEPVSRISLSSDLVSIDESEEKDIRHNAISNSRPNIQSFNDKQTVHLSSIVDDISKRLNM